MEPEQLSTEQVLGRIGTGVFKIYSFGQNASFAIMLQDVGTDNIALFKQPDTNEIIIGNGEKNMFVAIPNISIDELERFSSSLTETILKIKASEAK